MNHKQRVLKALNHEQPDRVPMFYWGVPEFTAKMISQLGFSGIDEMLEFLDVDFRSVEPAYTGPSLIDGEKGIKTDIWGVEYQLAGHGDLQYWDAFKFPLKDVTDIEVLNNYPWPTTDLFDFSSLDAQCEKYRNYAIMSAPGFSSPGLFRIVQRLLGRDAFLDVMMYHPRFFKVLTEKITDFYTDFIDKFFSVTGNRVDFIRIADDLGAESGLIISTDTWDTYVRPAIDKFAALPKQIGVNVYMHSCGAVRKLLPDFISAGVSVLDPIQTRTAGMSPEGLKKDFGHLITFSGALDEELLLRKGTPQRVKEGVNELLEIMAAGGGFFLGPSHKLKVETPVENVTAMYEAARAWRY